MANEIQCVHDQTGETLYAVVRNSLGQCWNGAAFEARTVANWGTYDIALAETPASSYFYVGNFPAAAAGFYWIDVYVQTGGSPAITDFRAACLFAYWNGTALLAGGRDAVQISGDAGAADALETVLDGTGGAVLKAAQLKLECDVAAEGALDCRNTNESGYGQYNSGGNVGQYNFGGYVGQYNYGGYAGQYNFGSNDGQYNYGGDVGQYNFGSNDGQYNSGGDVGQRNLGGNVGQYNDGPEAQKNEGTGGTPKALTLIGAADRIDDILADTADMQPRFTGITSLAAWLRGLFRKDAMDATAKSEVNTGGGTFDEATDSVEALRDTPPMGSAMRGTDSAALASTFAGITSLAAWLRGLFRKDAMDATAKTEVNSGGGGYDEATDSQERQGEIAADTLADTGAIAFILNGITSLAAWLRGLARSDAMDATAKAQLNAGGGTYDETLHSQQALEGTGGLSPQQTRDAMTLAPTAGAPAAGSVDAHLDAIQAKTNLIGTADLEAASPVSQDGEIEIVQGDDYLEADGRALEWTEEGYAGPVEDGDEAVFSVMTTEEYHEAGGAAALTVTGTAYVTGSGPATLLRIVVELTAAQTAALAPSPPDEKWNYTYQVRANIGSSGSGDRFVTVALGAATVKKKVIG